MARGLDHIVHAVRDLDAAAELYRRLGFTIGARNRHPWGTHNHLVQLPGFFIEVLTMAEPGKLGTDGFSTHFGKFNQSFLSRYEGLSLLMLESTAIEADAAALQAAQVAASDILRFEREGKRPDGSSVTVGFSLAFARDPATGEAGFALCQQHHPQNFWDPNFQQHPNGATAVAGAVLVAENPTDHHIFLSAFSGERELHATSLGVSVTTPRGDIQILDAAAFQRQFGVEPPDTGAGMRLAAFRVRVRERETLLAALETGEVDFSDRSGLTVIPPGQAMGATLVFEQG